MNIWSLIKEHFGFYYLLTLLFIPIIILYLTTRLLIYAIAWYSERKHQTKIKVGSVKFFQLDDITIQLSNGLTIVSVFYSFSSVQVDRFCSSFVDFISVHLSSNLGSNLSSNQVSSKSPLIQLVDFYLIILILI